MDLVYVPNHVVLYVPVPYIGSLQPVTELTQRKTIMHFCLPASSKRSKDKYR